MRKKVLLLITVVLCTVIARSQGLPDSSKKDSLQITQDLQIHQQQKKLDSLIKQQLQAQLARLSGDSKQKDSLQRQLRQIVLNDSLRSADQKRRIEQLKATAKGYPVTLLHDTLFNIYLRLGSFNPAERAAAISTRIQSIYDDDFFSADTLTVVENENTYDVVYRNDMIVVSVTELDALFHDKTPKDLATEYLQIIRSSIVENRQNNSLANWSRRVGYAILVLFGIALVFWGISRLFSFFTQKLVANKDRYFKGIHIKSFKLFNATEHLRFSLRVIGLVKIIAILLALYLSLPLLFSIFPQTREYTRTLLHWIISPAKSVVKGLVNYLPNLFTILVIYLFTRYAVRGVQFLADEVEKGDLRIKGFYPDWAHPTFSIVRFLLYAFMIIVVFPYLPGSGSPVFQGVSVFLGVLFSLGSTSAIGNIVAGLVITYMRPFKVGDRVKVGEIIGDVLEKSMLVTRIRTIKNEEITVPNSMVLSSHTTNYTTGAENKGLIIHTTVTIGYDVPWQKIHKALLDAADRTAMVLKEPAPFVLQTSLEDFYVAYQLNGYTRYPSGLAGIYSDLHQHIQDCCNEAGIEILSPHYRAMRDGNTTTIPEDYLAPDYKAPSFRVSKTGDKES